MLLNWFPVLFYCHFPDKLLICNNNKPHRKGWYRRSLDALEEYCLPLADTVLVNSKFTQQIVAQEFPRAFSNMRSATKVLYPALDTAAMDVAMEQQQHAAVEEQTYQNNILNDGVGTTTQDNHKITMVSLNRYERKKNIGLILRAYALIYDQYPPETLQVIIAGGYDTQNVENVEYRGELERLAFQELGLPKSDVVFQTSISDARRTRLLQTARCVVYTPQNEHFGIVPLEVMYAGTPVICCNSGGPLETVVDGKTGFLCEPSPAAFAKAMTTLLNSPTRAQEMGRNGRRHVLETFGTERLAQEWNECTQEAYRKGQLRLQQQPHRRHPVMTIVLYVAEAGLALLVLWLGTLLLRHAEWLDHGESILGSVRRRFQSEEL